MEPSPTPDATRFTDPRRTSPTANTPGTLVSSNPGSRFNGQPLGGLPLRFNSEPERMNPFSSRSTTPFSHSVPGRAPIKMNNELADTRETSPLAPQRTEIDSRRFSPCASTTLDP